MEQKIIYCKNCGHCFKSRRSQTGYACEMWGHYDFANSVPLDGWCFKARLASKPVEEEEEVLPYTRIDPVLNKHISEIIGDFRKLIEKAKHYGLDIKLTPNSKFSLELYFHDDYPDTILVDKEELESWSGDLCDY